MKSLFLLLSKKKKRAKQIYKYLFFFFIVLIYKIKIDLFFKIDDKVLKQQKYNTIFKKRKRKIIIDSKHYYDYQLKENPLEVYKTLLYFDCSTL